MNSNKDSGRGLVLAGGGGHCKSVIDTIRRIGRYNNIVITDPCIKRGETICGCEVVGDDSVLEELFSEGYKDAFITVGFVKTSDIRRKLSDKLSRIGFNFVNIVDPSSVVSSSVAMGHGIYIGKNSVVNLESTIGNFAIINNGAIVEHECRLGDFTHVAVGAVLCGNVVIEDDTLIGANSTVLQGVHIGSRSIVGAGSTVLCDVTDGETVYGIVK